LIRTLRLIILPNISWFFGASERIAEVSSGRL
jgi:hypothetical protein